MPRGALRQASIFSKVEPSVARDAGGSPHFGGVDPEPVLAVTGVLVDPAAALDRRAGRQVVLVARDQRPVDAEVRGGGQREDEGTGGVALAAARGTDAVPDVAALVEQPLVEGVPEGEEADDLAVITLAVGDP